MLKQAPNKKQKEAITHPPSPLMILAGAGTGKTFTLESRIIYMIKKFNVNPNHILGITYTEKGANELKSRIVKQIGKKGEALTINTFHSFCFKILKEYTPLGSMQLLEESEAIHLFLERFDELGPFKSDEFAMDPQNAIVSSFIPFFNRMRDELIEISNLNIKHNENDSSQEIHNQLIDLKRIYPIFQKWKQNINVIDYGDMILSCYELLKSNKKILSLIQRKYRNIIIDEFQDNNFALNEIINLIVGERKHLTVVGDDDQVIYSFRGANMYNIKSFQNKYKENSKFKFVTLEKNYRSNQAILDLANSSIINNIERMDKTLKSNLDFNNQKPIRFWGEKKEQLNFLVHEIKSLKSEGISLTDIAILCRTHNQCSQINNVLQKSGIVIQPQYSSFFQIKEIRDIISWSQVIANGTLMDSALYRLISEKCGYKTTNKIFSKFEFKNLKSRFDLISKDKMLIKENVQLSNLVNQIFVFKKLLPKMSASEMIWEIVEKTNILTSIGNYYSLNNKFILLNVGQLLKRSQNFTKRNKNKSSLYSFNKYIETLMKTGGIPSIKPIQSRKMNGVYVNTIHGVKGGEFPVVFLPFLRSSSFPLSFRKQKLVDKPPDDWLKYIQTTDLTDREHHLQEERRLFYVAITRAKEKLYLLTPTKATSKLVKELPDHLIEDKNMKIIDEKEYQTYSNLRVKYENLIQNALIEEMYDEVINLSNALRAIKKHENGEKLSLGNQIWEKNLKKDLKKPFQPDIPETIFLSASSIETYKTCPLKFRFSKIDGLPQNAKKPQLIFGNIIHKVLQRFHEPNKEISSIRITRLLIEEWKKDDFDYQVREEKFKEQGIKILEKYVENIIKNVPEVIKTEEQFSFDIGPITIRGAIDRIDKIDEGLEIIDYKTSKTPSSAKNSLQLAIYSMYLEQLEDSDLGGIPYKSSFYFLRDEEDPIKSHSFSKDQIADAKEIIIEVAAGIKNKKFDSKTGKHCDWCDYKALACPAWEKI